MSKYQGLARVSIRCRPYQGVPLGTVRPLGYHPETFDGNDGRSRADWHRRIRAEYASAKSINRVAFINGEQVEPCMIDGSLWLVGECPECASALTDDGHGNDWCDCGWIGTVPQ